MIPGKLRACRGFVLRSFGRGFDAAVVMCSAITGKRIATGPSFLAAVSVFAAALVLAIVLGLNYATLPFRWENDPVPLFGLSLLYRLASRPGRGGSGAESEPPPPVGDPAFVELLPTSFAVYEGATYSGIVARVLDAEMNVIVGLQPTSYELVVPGDSDIATIHATTGVVTGTVGGVAAGPATDIRALYQADGFDLESNHVTVTVQIPSEGHPNEPPGMQTLLFHSGETVLEGGMFEETDRVSYATAATVRGNFEIDPADHTKLRHTRTIEYKVSNVEYTKGPTSGISFSAAHSVSANKFGALMVGINAAGEYITFAPTFVDNIETGSPVEPQAYDWFWADTPDKFAASAYVNVSYTAAPAGYARVALIPIFAGPSGWIAGVDPLTLGPGDVAQEDYADGGSQGGQALDLEPYCLPMDFQGKTRTVVDPDFPTGPTSVLELSLHGIIDAGNGGARIDSTHPQTYAVNTYLPSETYISFWHKLSLGYRGNSEITPGATNHPGTGGNKMFILHNDDGDGGLPGAIHFPGMTNSPLVGAKVCQLTPGISIPEAAGLWEHDGITTPAVEPFRNGCNGYVTTEGDPGDPGMIYPRGQWHFVEGVIRWNSTGTADGFAKLWINGVFIAPTVTTQNANNGLLIDAIQWAPVPVGLSRDRKRFTKMELDNVWGGGGPNVFTGTTEGDQHYSRFKDIYISGRYARAGEKPAGWKLAAVGDVTTIGQGDSVTVWATLVDENDEPLNVYGLFPKVVTFGGVDSGAWPLGGGSDANASWIPGGWGDHGRYAYIVTADADATIGQFVTMGAKSWPRIWNGTALVEGDIQPTITPLSLEIVA